MKEIIVHFSPELLLILEFIKQYAGMYSVDYFKQNNLNHIFSKIDNSLDTLLFLVMHMFSTWTTSQIQTCITNLQILKIIKTGHFFGKIASFLLKKEIIFFIY